jgi:AcrR family transcriptional regulator
LIQWRLLLFGSFGLVSAEYWANQPACFFEKKSREKTTETLNLAKVSGVFGGERRCFASPLVNPLATIVVIQQLVTKAEELFMRYGIRSIAMDDLARELGMSKKTLYQLVTNKEDLIRRVFTVFTEQQMEEIANRRARTDNAVAELVEVVQYMLAQLSRVSASFRYDLEKYYPVLNRELERLHESFFEAFIRENLEWGINEGLYRSNVDPEVIARIFVNTAVRTGHNELFPVHEYALDKLLEQLFLYHIHGVATVKGIQYIKQYLGTEAAEAFDPPH